MAPPPSVEIRSTWELYLEEKRRPEGMESERDWITDWDGAIQGQFRAKFKIQATRGGSARASAL